MNTTETTTFPTATGDCVPVEQQTVDPYRDDVEPSEFPDRPDELTTASVETYVAAFEQAFARNLRLSKESTQVDTMVTVENVSEQNGTWVVDVVSRTNTWAQGTESAEGTATVVHGDGARIHVRYHLTDVGLYRNELGYDETPVAGEFGRAVACFD